MGNSSSSEKDEPKEGNDEAVDNIKTISVMQNEKSVVALKTGQIYYKIETQHLVQTNFTAMRMRFDAINYAVIALRRFALNKT